MPRLQTDAISTARARRRRGSHCPGGRHGEPRHVRPRRPHPWSPSTAGRAQSGGIASPPGPPSP
eukprot:1272117-Lingulodinium_polyedra.AAC.1